ncbi:MAG: cellulase family glycosylhydrolase [Fibromonadaceae bacterium]|jgi:hypothetical protein|nr:cellulase family glycosylhydrolase [Fibromonadaceae bacterium]
MKTSHRTLAISHLLALALIFLATSAFAGPVSHFGALKVCKISNKGRICGSKNGLESTPVQVKGPSLFWHSSAEGAPFYVPETVDWFVDNMEVGIVRTAMGVRYLAQNMQCQNSGPINGSGSTVLGYWDAAANSQRMIERVVDAAIENDVYVIVNWHSHDAHNETARATTFFRDMATKYKDVPNIIWEIYNEPVCASATQITTYANTIINAIRNAGSNNLILIGSRSWSQFPYEQAQNWGGSNNTTGSNNAVTSNVAFTFHFYAATPSHSSVQTNAQSAIDAGYAVFGSEWGFSQAEGTGGLNQATSWRTWMDGADLISNCNWGASAKDETSAMFTAGTTVANLSTNRLTTSGGYFNSYMTENNVKKWMDFIPANHPKASDVSISIVDGESVALSATQLGLASGSTISGVGKPLSGLANFTSNGVTYETSPSGSQEARDIFSYYITQNGITAERRVLVTITNRRPYLPQKDPLAVSRKTRTSIGAKTTLSASDPASDPNLTFKDTELSDPSIGILSYNANKDTVFFTPNESQHNVSSAEVTLNYTIQNSGGTSSSGSIVLQLQNFAPSINQAVVNNCCAGIHPNTGPIRISISQVGGRDRDDDSLWFVGHYLHPQYPGTLEQISPDTLIYYPEANRVGSVVILSVITDGLLDSPVGRSVLRLSGNGTDIGDLPAPPITTEIPNYNPTPVIAVTAGSFGLKSFASGIAVDFAQSGMARLDVYSLSGRHVGTLLNGWQNIGTTEVSLKNLNLQKGVYILRLKQGAQVKTLRVVN